MRLASRKTASLSKETGIRDIRANVLRAAARIRPVARGLLLVSLAWLAAVISAGCATATPEIDRPAPASSTPASLDVRQIINQYIAATDSGDSIMKMRAQIEERAGPRRELQMTVTREREPDGRTLMLVEFTSPAEERDRNAIITIFPDGEIEGMRYVQSNDSFASTKGATNEDSLFGMTLQELADGQPEKYEFELAGEETFESAPVYRVLGTLRPGAESRFPRIAMLISKENFTARTVEFYDDHDELARLVTISKVDRVDGRWTRLRWAVDNRARGKMVEFEVLTAKYTRKIDDSLFSREHLKKISSR